MPDLDEKSNPWDAPFAAWKKAPTPQNTSTLLTHTQPILDTAIRSYGRPSPNMSAKAKLMAIDAFGTYNPEKGNLKTHLLSQLRGLHRSYGQEGQIISVPERVLLQKNMLISAERDLEDKLGRSPSDSELSSHTGLSGKRLAYIRQANLPRTTGSFETGEGEDGGWTPASTIPGDNSREDAWLSFINHDLSPQDQLVLDHTLGRNGRRILSTDAIARKLGVTAGAVSQRKSRLQTLLDEGANSSLF